MKITVKGGAGGLNAPSLPILKPLCLQQETKNSEIIL